MIEGFDIPESMGQFDSPWASLRQLLDEAPPFTEGMAAELAVLCRNHVAIRSALMYSMVVAREAEIALRQVDTIEECKKAQGKIEGLEHYLMRVIGAMEMSEHSKDLEPEDEVE